MDSLFFEFYSSYLGRGIILLGLSEIKKRMSTNKTPRIKKTGLVVHKPVFIPTLIIIIVSVTLALLFHEQSEATFNRMQNFVSEKGGWIYS